jgi:hypothetical protein
MKEESDKEEHWNKDGAQNDVGVVWNATWYGDHGGRRTRHDAKGRRFRLLVGYTVSRTEENEEGRNGTVDAHFHEIHRLPYN